MSSNNGLRSNTIRILNEMAGLKDELCKMRPEQIHRSCLNCTNWNNRETYCTKFMQTPPLNVIVWGCDDWFNLDDDCPF